MIKQILLAFIVLTSSAFALPSIQRPITDPQGYIPSEDRAALSEELQTHREKTGVQIAILIIDTLNGVPIEDYAVRVARQWGGGSAARDDGILFVLAIKDRRLRIEVGYGLEPAVSDGRAAQILDRVKPKLKSQDYAGAIGLAIDGLRKATQHLTPAQVAEGLPRPPPPETDFVMGTLALMALALLLTFFVTRTIKSYGRQAGIAGTAVAVLCVFLGAKGVGWAAVLLVHLLIAQVILRTFFANALKLNTEDDEEPIDSAPRFYRGCLLACWFLVPIVSQGDDDFTSTTTAEIIDSLGLQISMVLAMTFFFGSLFHVMRAFGSGSGGGATSSGGSSWSDTFDSSSWSDSSDWSSSSSDWSSSSSDWSSSSSDWGGGGGDFGGGGASDSW